MDSMRQKSPDVDTGYQAKYEQQREKINNLKEGINAFGHSVKPSSKLYRFLAENTNFEKPHSLKRKFADFLVSLPFIDKAKVAEVGHTMLEQDKLLAKMNKEDAWIDYKLKYGETYFDSLDRLNTKIQHYEELIQIDEKTIEKKEGLRQERTEQLNIKTTMNDESAGDPSYTIAQLEKSIEEINETITDARESITTNKEKLEEVQKEYDDLYAESSIERNKWMHL